MKAINFDRIFTITRNSSASYIGSDGVLYYAQNNEQRFNHNPESLDPIGLLIEPQSTNLTTQSENSYGDDYGGGRTIEQNTQDILAPDGTNTVNKVTATVGGSGITPDIVNMVAGEYYTFSFWAAKEAGESILADVATYRIAPEEQATVTVIENTSPGVVDSLELKRYHITVRCDTSGKIRFRPFVCIQGQAHPYGYYWGLQVEQSNKPSSYIPTSGSVASRESDTLIASMGTFYNDNAGTWIIEGEFSNATILSSISNVTGDGAIVVTYDIEGEGKVYSNEQLQGSYAYSNLPSSTIDVASGDCIIRKIDYYPYILNEEDILQEISGNVTV